MSAFEKNIISIYPKEGKVWLANLPKKVKQLERLWDLKDLKPVENLSHNYVLSGYQNEKPIILKIAIDVQSLDREAKALEAFEGYGAVTVLAHEGDALLLQKVVPGKLLKNHPNGIKIACDVAAKLHKAPLSGKDSFPHIKEWLATLDKEWAIPKELLHKARDLKNQLMHSQESTSLVLLHGDLHRENILSHGEDWLVIDPKGVIGYPINEMWALVEDLDKDFNYISKHFGFEFNRVIKWYFVHVVLAACWCVEDKLDPQLFLGLAHATSAILGRFPG